VDVLVNTVRRALSSNLQEHGWRDLPGLMIHRRHQYVEISALADKMPAAPTLPYFRVLNHFTRGGKVMLAPRFLREPGPGTRK
jgi:hypothetical protein